MPFEKARLLELVKGQPLPISLARLATRTGRSFILKYVSSHPALTCAILATTNPDHVVENMGALEGALRDNSIRASMVKHMESLSDFDNLL